MTILTRLEERATDFSSAREDVIREQGVSRAAQERGNILERQLSMAQERLTAIQGAQTLDLVAAAEAAQVNYLLFTYEISMS